MVQDYHPRHPSPHLDVQLKTQASPKDRFIPPIDENRYFTPLNKLPSTLRQYSPINLSNYLWSCPYALLGVTLLRQLCLRLQHSKIRFIHLVSTNLNHPCVPPLLIKSPLQLPLCPYPWSNPYFHHPLIIFHRFLPS